MKNLIASIFIATLLLVAGCATANFAATKSVTYQPTTVVEVLNSEPTKPHEVFGLIEGQGTGGTKITDILEQMVRKAKDVGADALYIKETSWSGNFHVPHVVGYAIKYK